MEISFSSLGWVLMQATACSGSCCWGHDVCLVSQLNIMKQIASETCFCKWSRRQDVLKRGNNSLGRTDFLELWPAEVLLPISNPIASPSVPLF